MAVIVDQDGGTQTTDQETVRLTVTHTHATGTHIALDSKGELVVCSDTGVVAIYNPDDYRRAVVVS